MDLLFAAKYPFSQDARNLLREYSLSTDYETAEHAFNQTTKWLNTKDHAKEFIELNRLDKTQLENLVLSFPMAKILCALAGRPILKKLATTFETRTQVLLKNNPRDVPLLMNEFFKTGSHVNVIDFLHNKPDGYTLSNVPLTNGIIQVTPKLAIGLISRKAANKIQEFSAPKHLGKNFTYFADELRKAFAEKDEQITGPINYNAFPPCMKHISDDLKTKDNVGHMSRFVYATFLANIGMNKEELIKKFENQANFNYKRTDYYLSNLMGEKGGTKYSCPACEKLVTYGICYKDETCRWPHPLRYYKIVRKQVPKK